MLKKSEPDGQGIKQGAHWDGQGVNFVLYSEHAESVVLCLFDDSGHQTGDAKLQASGDGFWSAYIAGAQPGQHYGYRVHGPYKPKKGHRYNSSKLLLDPYARAINGKLHWQDALYAYDKKFPKTINKEDSAPYMLKAVVVDPAFDWEGDIAPKIPIHETVIYEMHVKGFTRQHPAVPESQRGTYLGLTAPAVLDYLSNLGVTSLEFLPCAASVTDQRLTDLELTNYWGYDPIALFAPDPRFAVSDAVKEFKTMVKALHRAGFEVILDVVFNHSGEGNENGPHLCFRGIDNSVYYRLNPKDLSRNHDTTGCGNSLNTDHPQVLQMVLDCLRYWAVDMHVDGFRFDLATTIAREDNQFNPQGRFLQQVAADPVLSKLKLIAEPWDLGESGYQLGQYPPEWSEWNDRFRDTVRAYWRGDASMLPELARRFTGSEDFFGGNGRGPQASVNFITAHDGFTLADLVSYRHKHNKANGEDNRDGHNHNLSHNYGVEGPSDDPEIRSVRACQQRNMLTTLLFSQGVPMLLAGDEIGRSQQGNNNTYCQDNTLNWLNWELDKDAESLLAFVRLLLKLRKQSGVFKQQAFLSGKLNAQLGYRDIEWLRPDGIAMSKEDWHQHYARCITILITAADTSSDSHALIIFNAGEQPVECVIPPSPEDGEWQLIFDTSKWSAEKTESQNKLEKVSKTYRANARSAVFMQESISGRK